MPTTTMDWATVVAAICAVISVIFLFVRRTGGSRTKNTIKNGSHNNQFGSAKDVSNKIENGSHNNQGG